MGVFNAHFCLIKSLPAQAVVLFLCPIIFQLINHEVPVEAAGRNESCAEKIQLDVDRSPPVVLLKGK